MHVKAQLFHLGSSHSRRRSVTIRAMTVESVFIILLSVAMVVAMAARRFGIPYTVALVLAGVALGGMHFVTPPHLTKDLLFTIFLPGLLFEASYALHWDAFRKHLIGILLLAVPGVVVTI